MHLDPAHKSGLRTVFDKIDSNGNGSLYLIDMIKAVKADDEELHNITEAIGISTSSLMNVFHEMDANRSGDIDWDEFQCYVGLAIKRHRGEVAT